MSAHDNEELIDYEDEHDVVANGAPVAAGNGTAVAAPAADGEGDKDKKNFSGIHSTGFRYVSSAERSFNICTDVCHLALTHRDFLLKPELLRAISDLGFEHPSEGLCYIAHVSICIN